MNKLKMLPCPFCGGEASIGSTTYSEITVREQEWDQDTFYHVGCMHCGGECKGVVGFETREAAAAEWNKRVMPPCLEIGALPLGESEFLGGFMECDDEELVTLAPAIPNDKPLFTEREAFLEIADAALQVQETTGADVFVDYRTDISLISIQVYPHGWGFEICGLCSLVSFSLKNEQDVGEAFRHVAAWETMIMQAREGRS